MSRQEFSVSYHGADRKDDHTIDVQVLAPALLAFGKLLREANTEISEKKSTTKVLVVSDFEHKCFQIHFELLSWWQDIKTLMGSTDVKTSLDILKWVGIAKDAKKAGYSFFEFLKWKNGRKVELIDKTPEGYCNVTVQGEGHTVQVHNHIYNLSNNSTALKATRDALSPLGQDGFDQIKFEGVDPSDPEADLELSEDDAQEILASCNQGIEESKKTTDDSQITTAWLSVYSPVYDLRAPNWRFKLGTDVVYVDISNTTIAQDAIDRGGALVHDSYQVKLKVTIEMDSKGHEKDPVYEVLEVLLFIPAIPPPQQTRLF